MATSPIYSWPEPDNTDLVKNGALAIRTLGNAIDTTMGTMVAKTIIDAKGDLIAGTAADTAARLAVGNNGETLVADSSTSTGLRYQGSAIGKNGVFNSGYDVFQRTSTPTTGLTTTGGIAYTIDRWQSWTTAAGGSVVTSQQATGDTTNLPFVRYCARFRRATSNTDTGNLVFGQPIENTDSARFVGQTVTFSFYARKGANYSATSNTMFGSVWTSTTTDQGLNYITGGLNPISVTATLTSTWQRFQGTATLSASATQIAFGFFYSPTGTAGAADYFEVTGVQLELGSIATPFAKMGDGTIQRELAACQRYYFRASADAGNTYAGYCNGYTESTTAAYGWLNLPVPMRVTPTSIDYSNIAFEKFGGTGYTASNCQLLGARLSTQCIGINLTISGATAGWPGHIRSAVSATGYVGFSAEL
jgi:hypothetical protein